MHYSLFQKSVDEIDHEQLSDSSWVARLRRTCYIHMRAQSAALISSRCIIRLNINNRESMEQSFRGVNPMGFARVYT